MNRTVKLYCSVKRPSGDWGTKPVPDKQLMNLKDLPEGRGTITSPTTKASIARCRL